MSAYGEILTSHIDTSVHPAFLLSEKGKVLSKNRAAKLWFPQNRLAAIPQDPASLLHTVTVTETSRGMFFRVIESVESKDANASLYCMFFVPAAVAPAPTVFDSMLNKVGFNTDSLLKAVADLCAAAPDHPLSQYAQETAARFARYQYMLLGYTKLFNHQGFLDAGRYHVSTILEVLLRELPKPLHELPYVFDCNFKTHENVVYDCSDLSYMFLNIIGFLLSHTVDTTIHGSIEVSNTNITFILSTAVTKTAYHSYRNGLISKDKNDTDCLSDFALFFANRLAIRGGGSIVCDYATEGKIVVRLTLPRISGDSTILLSAGDSADLSLTVKQALRETLYPLCPRLY